MTIAEYKQTSVDVTGLLKVLGENLYSRPEVAVRELIQNASDAITRRQLQGDHDFKPRIEVYCQREKQQLTIVDNGSGLTADEIERFLARIGSGFTRSLRKDTESGQLIGAFGLGFLTAYMIGERVEVRTTSMNGSACRFLSENGERYIVSEMEPEETGSKVIIRLKDTYEHLADPYSLREIVDEYCRLMKVEIYVQGASEPVNLSPPWHMDTENEPLIRLQKRRHDFALEFEPSFEPICTLPVDIDEGRGLMWIHDRSTYGGSDNRWMQIYIRGMMVVRNKHDFLPGWAGFISGIFEAEHLSPTASREDLIQDETYYKAKQNTAQALNQGLVSIAKTQSEVWRVVLRRHNEALLGAAIADEGLFNAIHTELKIPTSEGELTLDEIAARSPNGLALALEAEGGADEIVSRAFGTPVILGYRYGAAAMAAKYARLKDLDLIELGTERGHQVLFPSVQTDADTRARIESLFAQEGMTLILSKFEPAFLTCLCFVDAEQSLKAYFESDEADKTVGKGALTLARAFTKKIEATAPLHLVVNLNSPLLKALEDVPDSVARATAKTLTSNARVLCKHKMLGAHSFADAIKDMNEGLLDMLGVIKNG